MQKKKKLTGSIFQTATSSSLRQADWYVINVNLIMKNATQVIQIEIKLFKELPKLYEYNMGWGSLRFINREAWNRYCQLFTKLTLKKTILTNVLILCTLGRQILKGWSFDL